MSSNMENKPAVERVEEAAATWLLKRESPQWSPSDEAKLAEWLQASASHRVSFMRLGSVWREAGRLKAVSAGFAPGKVPPRDAIARSPFFSRKQSVTRQDRREAVRIPDVWFRALAAAVLIAVLGTTVYFGAYAGRSYRTPVGGLASVPMEDGSKVTLNTDSEVEIEIGARQRRVNLTRGEAFFEVAKDPARPFVVYANDERVIAVGTRFSVRLRDDAIQVTVTEGHVRVERSSLLGAREPLTDLVAGNVASAGRNKIVIQEKTQADVEQSLSWRVGYISLRKALLGDAVMEFNRYNRRQLVIDDPALAQIRVGGNFQSDNVDGFVRLLQQGFQIQAEEHNDRIVLRRKPLAE